MKKQWETPTVMELNAMFTETVLSTGKVFRFGTSGPVEVPYYIDEGGFHYGTP